MSSAWEVKMRVLLCVLLAACVFADKPNDNRRNKLPFVADAVGNTLPPPSNVPASVGSPVNLLTPDRYEFYTFDESGELVKRLMTLEEIQAIVAAGEESEGLVTFANENQPTIAFNFSQPSHTKVHSVVTNVQNVLKAQMEAHKNKPLLQPTLDTPDVSDSWSLILPSIFGNTGVDIVPDKSSGTFTTPETETFDFDHPDNIDENFLSKEDISSPIKTTIEKNTVTEKITYKDKIEESTTTTTSTSKPVITTTKRMAISTTTKILPSTTSIPSSTTQQLPMKTTSIPNVTTKISPTTLKPFIRTTAKMTTTKPQVTTVKPQITTNRVVVNNSIPKDTENSINVEVRPNSNTFSSTEKNEIIYEKISTFIPLSTVSYVTNHLTTIKPITTTRSESILSSTTKRSIPTTTTRSESILMSTTKRPVSTTTTKTPVTKISANLPPVTTINPAINAVTYISSTLKDAEFEKSNGTTITTQSVSPSTTVSSTEFLSPEYLNRPNDSNKLNGNADLNNEKENEPMLPMFDVAQSISQIASDLGNNYQPIPTTADLLDTTKVNAIELESKENVDLDIPSATEIEQNPVSTTSKPQHASNENFVKISTLDPHEKDSFTESKNENQSKSKQNNSDIVSQSVQKIEVTTVPSEETTIDPVLSESMDDLLLQVVNENPQISVEPNDNSSNGGLITTTEKIADMTTLISVDTTSEGSLKIEQETTSPTTEVYDELETTTIIGTKEQIYNTTKEDDFDAKEINNKHTQTPPTNIFNKETLSNVDTSDRDQNFVQIAMFSDKNETATESNGKIENAVAAVDSAIENQNPVYKEQNGTTNSFGSIIIETTTASSDEEVPTTTVLTVNEIKFSPSKINQIIQGIKSPSSNKKDKISQLLPKIDDFKKKIQKVNIDEEELISKRNNSWKLVPTLSPPKVNDIPKDKLKSENYYTPEIENKEIILEISQENQGLEVTTRDLGDDIAQFTELCNELAFRYWNVMVENIDKRRSFVLSPYSITSMLAMMFMGARGATSGEMNEILKLDDMVTFNPHFTLKNISDSIDASSNSGVVVSAFIRELYSDRTKGKILTFYKERAQHFYNGHVEEINFKLISDIIRRRTNLLVKRYTWGKIAEYMKTNNIVMQPPLAAFSANIYQTDCTGTSVDGRDGEMYFVVSPNVRQRRLVPVPAVVYKSGFLAGYDPTLDATAAALGNTNSIVSTLFLMPGQQGNVVHADDLEKLEQRLLDSNPTTPTWSRLLRSLLPRTGLELQIPRFSHKSIFNVSSTLKKMGLKDLFDAEHADLGGLNGPSKDLFLSDMIQLTTFVTCGEGVIGDQHHIEEYPETLGVTQKRRSSRWLNDWDEPRDYQRAFHDPHDVSDAMHLPLHLRPRQARLPSRSAQPARLKYDRPFLYFVRHNPSGMILYFGRYNPRLLP